MSSDSKEIEVPIEHPLEEVFDIEAGTTLIPRTEKTTDMVQATEYDEKDNEIEDQFQEIYDKAIAAFDDQVIEAEVVEGKYKARNMEVAVQLLNSALAAAKEKSGMKQHKDKTALAKGKLTGSGTTNYNTQVVVADRNDILKTFGKKDI